MKFWSAKDALSNGAVSQVEGKLVSDRVFPINDWRSLKLGRDCFRTKQDAVERANQLRLRKMESLQKQLAKLRAMSFDTEEPKQ